MFSFLKATDFKTRLIVEVAIIFLSFIVLGSLILILGGDLGKRALAVQEKKGELQGMISAASSLDILKSDLERAKPYFSVLQNILPTRDKLIQLPRDLEAIAGRAKIDFNLTFGAETAAQENKPGYVAVTMSLGGRYKDIVQFLDRVGGSGYLVDWGAIDIVQAGDKYRVSVNSRVFSQ